MEITRVREMSNYKAKNSKGKFKTKLILRWLSGYCLIKTTLCCVNKYTKCYYQCIERAKLQVMYIANNIINSFPSLGLCNCCTPFMEDDNFIGKISSLHETQHEKIIMQW